MMENPNSQQLVINSWLGEAFRLTAFFPTPVDASNWWDYTVGELPEIRKEQPKEGILNVEGTFEAGRLVFSYRPGRADWVFYPSFDKEFGAVQWSNLLPFTNTISQFLVVAKRWLEICPPLSRIAFGSILDISVPDKSAGYRELTRYLTDVQIDPDHSTDFLYQINRQRQSTIAPNININRLSKWTVITTRYSQIALNAFHQMQNSIEEETRFFTRLELDINTAPECEKFLSDENRLTIFSELVELAIEIADKGDLK